MPLFQHQKIFHLLNFPHCLPLTTVVKSHLPHLLSRPFPRRLTSLPPKFSKFTSSATPIDLPQPLCNDDVVSLQREEEPETPKEILEELSRSVRYLTCESRAEGGSCDVYLVGTSHLTQKSCKAVETAIRFLKPQVVFLELCSSRVAMLTDQSLKVPTVDGIEDLQKKENLLGMTYGWCLAKVAHGHGVSPGDEFRVAFEEARKCGAKVILGDRNIQITWQRTWAKMSVWRKTKFLYSLLFKTKNIFDGNFDMENEFPSLMETLVHERDQYMSSKLLGFASEHNCAVAVVGRGHLQGIEKYWKQAVAVGD